MSQYWYYAESDRTRGPITFDQLIKLLSLLPSAKGILVWREGFDEWKTAESVREIVEQLFRPPPLIPRSLATAHISERSSEAPEMITPDVAADRGELTTAAKYQQQFERVAPELPPDQGAKRRGRIAFLVVLAIVVSAGAYFANQIFNNSVDGIANLIGQLAAPWIILTAITWKIRRSTYTAAAVLAVGALVTGMANIGKLQQTAAIQDSKAALQGITDPTKIDEALRQRPSNIFLQLMAMANKAATETNASVDRLSNEIEPPGLSKDVELVTAGRNELEALRGDLKTAEMNSAAFMPRYASLLKAEREKVRDFALSLHMDNNTVRSFLEGVDKRHATGTAFVGKMMLARFEFYRAYQDYVAVLLDEYGAYNVVNGKFTFPLQRTADRFNVAATAMDAAAKRMSELDIERKQLAQAQQDKWSEFVKRK